MPTSLVIRDIPEEVMAALQAKADAAGKSREVWLREQLLSLASTPLVRERYAYRVYGKNGKGKITRHSNHPNSTGSTFNNFSQEEGDAIHRAEDLMRRNNPGDLVKALAILQEAFEEVIEVPV